MKSVCYVMGRLQHGGLEEVLFLLCRELPRRGFRPWVLELRESGPAAGRFRAAGLPVVSLGLKRAPRVEQVPDHARALIRLVGLFRRTRPHIVHSHLFHAGVLATLAAAVARVPVRVRADHNIYPWKGRGAAAVDRATAMLTSALVAPSHTVAAHIRKLTGLPRESVRVLPNGLRPASARRETSRSRLEGCLGLTSGAGPLVGIVSRLTHDKGADRIVPMARHLLRAIPEARVVVIGDGPLLEGLESDAAQLPLHGRLHVLGPLDEGREWIAGLDVLVSPSRQEGFGLAVCEALIAGVPAVTTRIPAYRELLPWREPGEHLGVDTAQALAAEAVSLLRSTVDDRTKRAREEGTRLLERYPLEGMIEAYAALYEELLCSRRSLASRRSASTRYLNAFRPFTKITGT